MMKLIENISINLMSLNSLPIDILSPICRYLAVDDLNSLFITGDSKLIFSLSKSIKSLQFSKVVEEFPFWIKKSYPNNVKLAHIELFLDFNPIELVTEVDISQLKALSCQRLLVQKTHLFRYLPAELEGLKIPESAHCTAEQLRSLSKFSNLRQLKLGRIDGDRISLIPETVVVLGGPILIRDIRELRKLSPHLERLSVYSWLGMEETFKNLPPSLTSLRIDFPHLEFWNSRYDTRTAEEIAAFSLLAHLKRLKLNCSTFNDSDSEQIHGLLPDCNIDWHNSGLVLYHSQR